ncbi:carbohydrate esterase family 1 protein [Lophiostoma macrostomum CBS 122681]|uniref:feruloyl esterase n=1 Tax=Lophiostoma macrostomum CBS 122681 TaxID=1314788 RepID=A0A6A6T0C9_9PLEO|nr:carbohydrate esterase family 1 protein [Lophiostoma macrostomum CBS 122681]
MLTSTIVALLLFSATSGATVSSPGCGKPLPGCVETGHSSDHAIDSKSGASPRNYRIHVPKSYQNTVPVPLMFSFHGRGDNMKFQEDLSQFTNTSYGFEGISVFPEGVPDVNGTLQWQGDPDSHGIDDILFTSELLDELLNNYCIDSSRVYANGKSNGGGFTGLLACDKTATKRIAAFAPVSGAFYLDKETQELPPCTPTSTRDVIPILEFHGFKDKTITYNGGPNKRHDGNSTNIPKWVDGWANRNGFNVAANETTHLCSGPRLVTRYSWGDSVIHYNYTNLYHDWPSTFPNGDTNLTTCEDAEATRVILDWFGKWSL